MKCIVYFKKKIIYLLRLRLFFLFYLGLDFFIKKNLGFVYFSKCLDINDLINFII